LILLKSTHHTITLPITPMRGQHPTVWQLRT